MLNGWQEETLYALEEKQLWGFLSVDAEKTT
jgi:hypothetical protein